MTRLGGFQYIDVTKKIEKLGFEFYKSGKGSHQLWVNHKTKKVIPLPKHAGKDIKNEH